MLTLQINSHIYFMSRNASTDELYFVTLTVTDWIDVFTKRLYNDFIIENLAWCQKHKKLNIYAYVIMTNHIHMVANVTEGSLGDVLGHFKTYTSKEIFKMIANNGQESRRDWMIKAFECDRELKAPRRWPGCFGHSSFQSLCNLSIVL
jgi:putative transposase